jgi:hypothetical protein
VKEGKKMLSKMMLLFLSLTLVTGVALAQEGTLPLEVPVGVGATVPKYAAISVTDDTITLNFDSGAAGTEATATGANAAAFNVETNAAINVTFTGTSLTLGGSTILVRYTALKDGNTIGNFGTASGLDASLTTAQALCTTENYAVQAQATLGAISDQAAGNYSATVTITVAAQ